MSIKYDVLKQSYVPLQDGEEYQKFQGVWALKGEESVGLNIWNLKDDTTGNGGEVPQLASLVCHSRYDLAARDTFSLDVMVSEVTDCYVTDDNNKADWYIIHSLMRPNGELELEPYDGMIAPTKDRPTKIPQDGDRFPVEMAFHTQQIAPLSFQTYMSLPCEKDLVTKNTGKGVPPSSEMLTHLLKENSQAFPGGEMLARVSPSPKGWFVDWIAGEVTYPGATVVTNGACKYIAENYPNGIEFVHYCKGLDWDKRDVDEAPESWGNDPFVLTTQETPNRFVKMKVKIKAKLVQ